MDTLNTTATAMASPRSLVCHYNPSMVTAALVVSLLGAFTSTQLMSQARSARTLSSVLIWTVLGSLVFGFCATWCLHFLGMLSCEFDVPIGLNPPQTILSAILAILFTFGALSTELIKDRWRRLRRKKVVIKRHRSPIIDHHRGSELEFRQSSEPLLHPSQKLLKRRTRKDSVNIMANRLSQGTQVGHSRGEPSSMNALLADVGTPHIASQRTEMLNMNEEMSSPMRPLFLNTTQSDYDDADSDNDSPTAESQSRWPLNNASSGADAAEFSNLGSNAAFQPVPTSEINALLFATHAILNGLTLVNVTKGFIWSIALTNMHFMGVKALNIPGGFVALSPARVILCAAISWSVCCVGVILMAEMEVNVLQQVLFSVVAATGVAAVHFSGLSQALNQVFWS